ncbi:MAG: aminotransferase class I/II-fold pyridoxal phosphate-dependent enzyme [Bacteroidales bacterium]
MKIKDFALERFFSKYEFSTKYLMSSSDCDGYSMSYVLDKADTHEMRLWNNLHLGYTESAGNPMLKEAIAKYYHGVTMNNVVVGTPGELSFIIMNLLLEKDDHAIVVAPAYQSLYEVINSVGADVSFWKPHLKDNWVFDVDEFISLIKDNTRLIVLNFPHNPTGAYLKEEELQQIVKLARDRGIWIYSDEMYRKLILDSSVKELPAISDIYEKGISLWGTSKTFGLAGVRTGWVVSQNKDILTKIVSYKDYLSICSSAPSEVLSIIALNHIDAFLKPNITKIKSNIELFDKFLKERENIDSAKMSQWRNAFGKFVKPKVGSVSFIPLNIKGTSLDFSVQLIKKLGIMTVPAEMFEYPGKYLRIGFGREIFKEMLKLL